MVIYYCYINPFGADIPLTEKPGTVGIIVGSRGHWAVNQEPKITEMLLKTEIWVKMEDWSEIVYFHMFGKIFSMSINSAGMLSENQKKGVANDI